MATDHKFSVLANLYSKSPVSNIHEGNNYLIADKENEFDFKKYDFPSSRCRLLSTLEEPLSCEEISKLNDDEFYSKLQELRNEHLKTLKICEHIYEIQNSSQSFGDTKLISESAGFQKTGNKIISADRKYSATERKLDEQKFLNYVVDGKPPLQSKNTSHQIEKFVTLEKQCLLDVESEMRSLSTLLTDTKNERRLNVSRPSSTVGRLEGNRFVAKNEQRKKVEKLKNNKHEDDIGSNNWTHRTTIPKPFSMTIREENNLQKKHDCTKSYQEKKILKELEESRECFKKFEASPAPAHIYVPKYDEMLKKEEERRAKNKEEAINFLLTKLKPFSFNSRESAHERRRRHELSQEIHSNNLYTLLDSKIHKECRPSRPRPSSAPNFKASPAPRKVLSPAVRQQMDEEEQLRNIAKRIRSKEMLIESSLPGNMLIRNEIKEMKKKYIPKEMKIVEKKKNFHPKVLPGVPNYYVEHRKCDMECALRKYLTKPPTTTEPFGISRHQVSNKEKINKVKRNIKRDEATLREARWPFVSGRTKVPQTKTFEYKRRDAPPYAMTIAAEKRFEKALTSKFHEKEDMVRTSLPAAEKSKIREVVKRKIQQQNNTIEGRSQRVRRLREADQERQKEYYEELERVNTKINERPLLFEKQSQINAKKAIEKKFRDTLAANGIDERALLLKAQEGSGLSDDECFMFDDPSENVKYSSLSDSEKASKMKTASDKFLEESIEDGSYSQQYTADSDKEPNGILHNSIPSDREDISQIRECV